MTSREESRHLLRPTRTDALLQRKFNQYFLPSMLTAAAMSLSEFVDSMIVSNLLGSRGMAIVQLGSPITLICAAVYMLIGSGGSIRYAVCLGEGDREDAGTVFSVSVLVSGLIGLLLLLVGFVFFQPLTAMLCSEESLLPAFGPYYSALLCSVPFLVVIMSMVFFLPPSGSPVLATAINIVANVVNIGMDYVYIRVFNMGVTGAAWATLTGFAAGAAVMGAALAMKKVRILMRRPRIRDLRRLSGIAATGGASSLSQVGFALKHAVCNSIASACAATAGIVAFSLCIQSLSVVSIFLCAVLDSAAPLLGMLHGQRDYRGETLILKRSLIIQFFFSMLCTVYFLVFPLSFATLFGIHTDPDVEQALHALRIFALIYPFRGFCITFMRYLQVIGRKVYSLVISTADGFLLILPVCWIGSSLFGIDGLWWAYPVTAVILLAGCIIANLAIARRHPDAFSGVLLEEKDPGNTPLLDATVLSHDQDLAELSESIRQACEENGISREVALRAALLTEEMSVYFRSHIRERGYVDLIMRSDPGCVILDFRCIGLALNPNEDAESGDVYANILMLRHMSQNIESNYVMGMNNIRLALNAAPEVSAS